MKLYAIVCYAGEYEDKFTWIDSIWDDPQKAEEVSRRVIDEHKEMANLEIPDEFPDDDFDKWENLCILKQEGQDFNSCKVVEYELNKRNQ